MQTMQASHQFARHVVRRDKCGVRFEWVNLLEEGGFCRAAGSLRWTSFMLRHVLAQRYVGALGVSPEVDSARDASCRRISLQVSLEPCDHTRDSRGTISAPKKGRFWLRPESDA